MDSLCVCIYILPFCENRSVVIPIGYFVNTFNYMLFAKQIYFTNGIRSILSPYVSGVIRTFTICPAFYLFND